LDSNSGGSYYFDECLCSPSSNAFCVQIKTYYGIGQNLLIKFKDDQIDETPRLAQALSSNSAVSGFLDMSVRVLPGDHACPLLQV
jgi:hypothetical protein